jgi:NADPH-dependent 2,4-dienoyl-CoA reductase/sulfur reductase-like enzyme
MGQISQLLRSITALRLLSKLWMPLSKRVVLIGGGLVGLELAEYLHERGRVVSVIEPSPNLGAELSIVRRARVVHELRENGVRMHACANIVEIGTDAVVFEVDGQRLSEPAGHVIIAMGAEPDTSLADQLNSEGINAIAVGDCHSVGYIEGAVHSGRAAALSL